jgi:predicted N-formylglutamate amidohydrolase
MFPDACSDVFVLLTCEHGGCEVPDDYARCFEHAEGVLASHRGYDIGALGVAHRLAARLSVPLMFSTVTRLLVDLNRSLGQPDLWSEFTRGLTDGERSAILAGYYTPYRQSVARLVENAVGSGQTVIHLGVHSCADRLHDQDRDLDISLLFDETRERELSLCERWRSQLQRMNDCLRYPFNVPYRGSDDGLTTTLRGRFAGDAYLGIEIELRQGVVQHPDGQRAMGDLLADSLTAALRSEPADRA